MDARTGLTPRRSRRGRKLLAAAVVLAVGTGLALPPLFEQWGSRGLRRLLADRWPGTVRMVRVAAAGGTGLLLEGLELTVPDGSGGDRTVLRADRLEVRLDAAALTEGRILPRTVRAEGLFYQSDPAFHRMMERFGRKERPRLLWSGAPFQVEAGGIDFRDGRDLLVTDLRGSVPAVEGQRDILRAGRFAVTLDGDGPTPETGLSAVRIRADGLYYQTDRAIRDYLKVLLQEKRGEPEPWRIPVTVEVRDGTLRLDPPEGIEFSGVSAHLETTWEDRPRLPHERSPGHLRVAGTVLHPGLGEMHLTVRYDPYGSRTLYEAEGRMRNDPEIHRMLTAPVRQVCRTLGLRDGEIDVAFRADFTPRGNTFDFRARPRSASINYADFPLPLRDVEGIVEGSNRFVRFDVTGAWGESRFRFEGRFDDRFGERSGEREVRCTGGPIDLADREWVTSLPSAVRDPWERLEVTGRVDRLAIGFKRSPVRGGGEAPVTWTIRAEGIPRLALESETLDIEGNDGTLDFEAFCPPGQRPHGEGSLRLDRARWHRFRFAEFRTPILLREGRLEIGPADRPMRARLGRSGGIAGTIEGDFNPSPVAWRGQIAWGGVPLEDLLESVGAETRGPRGELDGRIRFPAPDGAAAQGYFELDHADGLFELPLLFGMSNALWGSSTGNREIREVDGTFVIRGDRIEFDRHGDLIFMSRGSAIEGSGWVALDGSAMRLPFVVNLFDRRGLLTHIPIISWFRQALVQVLVTGSLAEPEVRVMPGLFQEIQQELEHRREEETRPPSGDREGAPPGDGTR